MMNKTMKERKECLMDSVIRTFGHEAYETRIFCYMAERTFKDDMDKLEALYAMLPEITEQLMFKEAWVEQRETNYLVS